MAGDPVNPLADLGRTVAGGLDAYAAERGRAIGAARERFLETSLLVPSRRPRRPRVVALLAAAAALVLVLVAGAAVERARRPLTFVANGVPASLETWLAAGERPLPVDFSDGTRLRLEPASRMRVIDVERNGASVALENGTLHADVVHRPASAWRVIAGPLTVRVTGTRFDLRWSAASEEFALSVREGSVAVSGAVVGGERPVRAGETLEVRVGEKRLVLANSAELEQARRGEASIPGEPPGPNLPAPAPPGSVSASPPAASPPELAPRDDWRELARRGHLRKAFTAAEASGFDSACASSTAAELLQLGDAARLSGRPERARQALLALRERYPTDPRRAAAAFALGKVAFDQSGAFAQAAEWFATSLREQPNGSLSREAAGRLIEAYQRAGNAAAAETAARSYLARHPDGPHADVARSIVR